MLYRSQIALLVVPTVLAAALMFALAPACTMPSCGSVMGLAGMLDHHGEGCQDYMMVDDNPDGLPTPQAPVVAVLAVAIPPVDSFAPFVAPSLVETPQNPEFDPLGVRIRI